MTWDTQCTVTPTKWCVIRFGIVCLQIMLVDKSDHTVYLHVCLPDRGCLPSSQSNLFFSTGNISNPMIVYQLQRYLVYCLPVSQIMVFTSTKLKRYLQVCLPVMKLLATCQNHRCLFGKTDKISPWLFISYGVACHVQTIFFSNSNQIRT